MKTNQKNIRSENKRTVLQPVHFSAEDKNPKGILSPDNDYYDEMVGYKNLRKKRLKRAITRVILWFFVIVLLPIMVFFTIVVFSSNSGHSFFGYTFYLVESNSMMPEFEMGDIIVVKTSFTMDEIQRGTDITFVRESDGKIITHRVQKYEDDEDGREYTTRGIHNVLNDENTVNYNNIIGVKVAVAHTLGQMVTFFRSTIGIIVLVLTFGAIVFGIYVSFRLSNDIRAVGK